VSREIGHKILGLFGAFLAGIQWVCGVPVQKGGGVFCDWAGPIRLFGGSSGRTGSSRPVFLIFTTEGKQPRDSRVAIKVIVVHKDFREMIPEVSGRWGMGLGSGF
jgi:hypothetical protein